LYRILLVSGPDAADFLQGQLTQDVRALGARVCLPAAWCNAQGRVVMTLKIVAAGADFALVVRETVADAALARLAMYRLRAKVEFAAAAGWEHFAVAETVGNADGVCRTKIGGSQPVMEIVAKTGALEKSRPTARLDDVAWQRARISAGLVDIMSENSALYTPHMLNLDLTGAISFSKGCYTGQEIVARTEHLGRSKRRTMRYHCEAPGLAIGDVLRDGAEEIGVVVNACGNELLAVVPVAAAASTLEIRGIAALPAPLPYALA
jgi:folate-binding protein YgfZ